MAWPGWITGEKPWRMKKRKREGQKAGAGNGHLSEITRDKDAAKWIREKKQRRNGESKQDAAVLSDDILVFLLL